ncbi:hypothetical protein F0562_026443 [Nyssa sinensis]|uniref:Histone-lysine N-methyltransferase n=1 Tax=Nyssa sinensis TaxID=561372 RepID=A0A5J5BF14_9ASTE|nr:hypothetical protein F0562_026443 [Nyssa sinensis]
MLPEICAQPKQVSALGSEKTLSKTQPLAKKFPPPKIRKGIPVFRQFPRLCGSLNNVSSSKSMVNGPLVESMRTNGNQVRGEIQEDYASERRLAGTALDEFVDKILAELGMGNETCNQVQGGTSAENEPSSGPLLDGNEKTDYIIPARNGESVNVARNGAQPKQIAALGSLKTLSETQQLAKKYPPPKIRKGVPVFREFPRLFGSLNNVSSSKSIVQAPLVESMRTNENQISGEIQERYASERELVGSASEEFVDKIIAEPSMGNAMCNQVQGGTSAENEPSMGLLFDGNDKESTDFSIVPFDNYRYKVRETLDQFEEIFKNLSREHQSESKGQRKASRQVHIEAAMVLKKQQKWVHMSEQFLGPVPGVEVGDQFRFRVELIIVGLHRQLVAGIDFMKKDDTILATSIVASGRYANDMESSDVLIYSGQGGNPSVVGDKKPEDQKLERGNLALKNSMDARTPVRVIRGCQTSKASNIMSRNGNKTEKIYIYDGLYTVSKYWQERGEYGKLVFMFQLNRNTGQTKLPRKFLNESKMSKSCKDFCVVDDVSQAKEKMPIRAMNAISDEKPPLFNYITSMIYPKRYNLPIPSGCDCTNGCSDSEKCSCAMKNGGEIPFNNNGSIVRAKPVVYECGPHCKCPHSCMNRVSQHGIRYKFEVFKTQSRGWGVRSRDYISSGSFICEYVGELLRDKEAEQRIGDDEYLFDIGNDTSNYILQDEPMARSISSVDKDDNGYTIDAARCGNIGRFINHSCSPNVYAQNVLYDHDDKKIPHIMLFASKHIPPLRELACNYNYKVDQVHDANGSIKKKSCFCGSRECTGRMY